MYMYSGYNGVWAVLCVIHWGGHFKSGSFLHTNLLHVVWLVIISVSYTFSFLDSPKARQFTSFSVTCDTSNGTYRASVTFNDDETGGSDIKYYNGTVTDPSGFSSQFNVTNNTVVIPGLQRSTNYSINVTAGNCVGFSTVTATSFTIPQPGECMCLHVFGYSHKIF